MMTFFNRGDIGGIDKRDKRANVEWNRYVCVYVRVLLLLLLLLLIRSVLYQV